MPVLWQHDRREAVRRLFRQSRLIACKNISVRLPNLQINFMAY